MRQEQEKRQLRAGGSRWRGLDPGDYVAPQEAGQLIRLSLPPESALDDLDLNEFGVAALEKTFDNSTVPHPGSITMGTRRWGAGVGSWGSAWPGGGPAGSALLGVAPNGSPALTPPSRPLSQVAVCCRAPRP